MRKIVSILLTNLLLLAPAGAAELAITDEDAPVRLMHNVIFQSPEEGLDT